MIRAEVVGSLLRPAYLVKAREALEAGRMSAAEFKRVEDRAVDEAIQLQEMCGLDVVTDGELRRLSFQSQMTDAVDGFGDWDLDAFLWGDWESDELGPMRVERPPLDEQGEELVFKRPVVVDKLRWRRSMCGEEFTYLRARTLKPTKVTLISTQQAAAYYDPQKSAGAYPTRDAYLADVVDLTRREVQELIRLGCTYVQIDAPQYAALLDPTLREGYRQRGSDPDRLIDACIEMDNAVIGAQPGVTFALHICRGNNRSMFYASGGYEPIARVFAKGRFQRFLLEYDDERSGGFEPLRAVPEDREVVLGLVTTKKPRVESVDELTRRIEEAAKHVPLARLALSPQCGFASTLEGNRIGPEDQARKLRVVAETARAVWGAS